MNKVRHIIINLSVILISFFLIDGGRTIMLLGNSIQIHLNHKQTIDLEIPHQHGFNKSDDDEKIMNSNLFELSCLINKLSPFPGFLNKWVEDYTGLVWQPPKSL